MIDMHDILQNINYGGFSLMNLVNENSDENEIEAPVLFEQSLYYGNDDFINLFKDKTELFIVLSLNCQSLNAKYSQLKIYMELFKMHGIVIQYENEFKRYL